jgi:hypothetical protein
MVLGQFAGSCLRRFNLDFRLTREFSLKTPFVDLFKNGTKFAPASKHKT